MSKFQKSLLLWCAMVALACGAAYVAIDFSLVRIGRVQSGELLRMAAFAEEHPVS